MKFDIAKMRHCCRIEDELFEAHKKDCPFEWTTMYAKCFGRYGIWLGIGYV